MKVLYVMPDKHRDGRTRWLFRRRGYPKVTLPGKPGSKEFMAAYAAALNGQPAPKKEPKPEPVKEDGTLGWLCKRYFASAKFLQVDEYTQRQKRWILEAVLDEPLQSSKPNGLKFRTCPLVDVTKAHVALLIDRKVKTPNAANARLAKLKQMFKWAVKLELMTSNPADATDPVEVVRGGHHTWTEEEVARYEQTHPVGTKARLLLDLALYTGMRISDLSQFGPQHIVMQDGVRRIVKTQFKNRNNRHAKTISVMMLPEVEAAVQSPVAGASTYLETDRGTPYAIKSLGNAVAAWCREAGLEQCSTHGLRKVGARRAAQNGASVNTLNAIFGWSDAKEAMTYTKAVDRDKMADEGMHLLRPKA
jgi:integrase